MSLFASSIIINFVWHKKKKKKAQYRSFIFAFSKYVCITTFLLLLLLFFKLYGNFVDINNISCLTISSLICSISLIRKYLYWSTKIFLLIIIFFLENFSWYTYYLCILGRCLVNGKGLFNDLFFFPRFSLSPFYPVFRAVNREEKEGSLY